MKVCPHTHHPDAASDIPTPLEGSACLFPLAPCQCVDTTRLPTAHLPLVPWNSLQMAARSRPPLCPPSSPSTVLGHRLCCSVSAAASLHSWQLFLFAWAVIHTPLLLSDTCGWLPAVMKASEAPVDVACFLCGWGLRPVRVLPRTGHRPRSPFCPCRSLAHICLLRWLLL